MEHPDDLAVVEEQGARPRRDVPDEHRPGASSCASVEHLERPRPWPSDRRGRAGRSAGPIGAWRSVAALRPRARTRSPSVPAASEPELLRTRAATRPARGSPFSQPRPRGRTGCREGSFAGGFSSNPFARGARRVRARAASGRRGRGARRWRLRGRRPLEPGEPHDERLAWSQRTGRRSGRPQVPCSSTRVIEERALNGPDRRPLRSHAQAFGSTWAIPRVHPHRGRGGQPRASRGWACPSRFRYLISLITQGHVIGFRGSPLPTAWATLPQGMATCEAEGRSDACP